MLTANCHKTNENKEAIFGCRETQLDDFCTDRSNITSESSAVIIL